MACTLSSLGRVPSYGAARAGHETLNSTEGTSVCLEIVFSLASGRQSRHPAVDLELPCGQKSSFKLSPFTAQNFKLTNKTQVCKLRRGAVYKPPCVQLMNNALFSLHIKNKSVHYQFGLAHQNRTIAIASDVRVARAKSPEIPQKEEVSASEIATRNRKSLATFHRILKSQCNLSLGNR